MELDKTSDDLSDDSESLVVPAAQVFRTPEPSLSFNLEAISPPKGMTPSLAPNSRPTVSSSTKESRVVPTTFTHTPNMRSSKQIAPPTPAQMKIVQKSVFGYDGDDLSEISDDADSLKALSQRQQRKESATKPIARKPVSGNRSPVVMKGRVLDSDDEEVFADRKKGSSNSVKRAAIIHDESEEDISPKQKQEKKQVLEPAAASKTRLPSSGRIESVSPVSSPVDNPEEDDEPEEPKKARRKPSKRRLISFLPQLDTSHSSYRQTSQACSKTSHTL